jgi:hypothetical protein
VLLHNFGGQNDTTRHHWDIYANSEDRSPSFSNTEELQACIRTLPEFINELQANSTKMNKWLWESVWRRGNDIIFNINWYEKDFFDERKNVFKNTNHIGYFRRLGINPEQLYVKHEAIGTWWRKLIRRFNFDKFRNTVNDDS